MISSAGEFLALLDSAAPEDRERARHERASREVWTGIVQRHPEARLGVAHNGTTPVEVLEALATDTDPRVRLLVAMRSEATPRLLDRLSTDLDIGVRMNVARHPNTARATLEAMVHDPWDRIAAFAEARLHAGLHR